MEDKEKIITADLLERFKEKQDIFNAMTFLARIVYPTLPTENNYEGRMAFQASDSRLYIYANGKWNMIPWYSESAVSAWTVDTDGNISPNV